MSSQDARIAALEAAMRKCGSCEDKKIAKGCPTPEPPPAENLEDIEDIEDIEGIGPKLAEVLHAGGIRPLKQLASTEVAELQKILKPAGGNNCARNDPSSWPQQARLMVEGKKAELHALQETLRAGRCKV